MKSVGVTRMLTPSISNLVWLRKNGFWSDSCPSLLASNTPVFSTTYISEAGHPEVMYETTTCCSNLQFRVNPMKSGVLSGTCSAGGMLQIGIGGSSAAECAAPASGKLSTIGRAFGAVFGLYFGPLGVGGSFLWWTSSKEGPASRTRLRRSRPLVSRKTNPKKAR